jgi:plastocyanin
MLDTLLRLAGISAASAAATVMIVAGGPLLANDANVVRQAGNEFDPGELSVPVGAVVEFVNDDTVAHNVFSRTLNNEFQLSLMAPGSTAQRRFARAGRVEVRCAVHPRMRLIVTVE